MVTSLDLLAKAGAESSPFTTNTPSHIHIDAFKSAFKIAGFSDGYAEEIIDSATARFQVHDEGRKRKRRLAMFEKRVRQVADTIKRMAGDIPREGDAQASLEGRVRKMGGGTRGNVTAGAEQFQRDDEILFAELLRLVNESRTWIANVPHAMPVHDERSSKPLYSLEWLDAPPPAVPQDSGWATYSTGWYDGPSSAQVSIEPEAQARTGVALSIDKKHSHSQSESPDGLGWDDMLPELKN